MISSPGRFWKARSFAGTNAPNRPISTPVRHIDHLSCGQFPLGGGDPLQGMGRHDDGAGPLESDPAQPHSPPKPVLCLVRPEPILDMDMVEARTKPVGDRPFQRPPVVSHQQVRPDPAQLSFETQCVRHRIARGISNRDQLIAHIRAKPGWPPRSGRSLRRSGGDISCPAGRQWSQSASAGRRPRKSRRRAAG